MSEDVPEAWIVTSVDSPGRNLPCSGCPGSSAIFTGIRCTTLVKFPVALSGGRSADCEPLAGAISTTLPVQHDTWKSVDLDVGFISLSDVGQLRLQVVGLDPRVALDQIDDLHARA